MNKIKDIENLKGYLNIHYPPMKLKDIGDMDDYLENRCYCPHEIYDMTGFFYELFYPSDECTLLAEGEHGAIHGKFVITGKTDNHPIEIVYIEMNGEHVDDCTRLDATKNNIEQILLFMSGQISKMNIDSSSATWKDAFAAMKYVDAIMI